MNRRVVRMALLVLVASVVSAVRADDDCRQAVRTQIARITPALVTVTELQVDVPKVFLRATTSNVNAGANFVENIKASAMFTTPTDIIFRERKGEEPKQYDIEFRFEVKACP